MRLAHKHALISISLVEKIQRGDHNAFERLVIILKRPLFRKIFSIVRDYDEAMDIMQDTFLRLYLNIHRLKYKAGLKCYVFRIAINRALNRKQVLRRETVSLSDDDGLTEKLEYEVCDPRENPEMETERLEFWTIIETAIKELPPQQRICFVLNDIKGFSKHEIAERVGCTPATVRSNLHNARNRVRKFLAVRQYQRQLVFN